MDKKEADFTVIEVDKEDHENKTGQFGEQHLYCSSYQKKEARLDEGGSTDDIQDKSEAKKSTDHPENMPIALDSRNKEPKNENEIKNKANILNASGMGLRMDEKHQKFDRNEYSLNKRISKVQESEDKRKPNESSFIRPTNAPSFKQSLKYAVEAVTWIFHHSIVLAIIPTIIIVVMYGSLWFIPINRENMKVYCASIELVYSVCMYAAVSGLFMYMFGKQKVITPAYKLGISLCLVHIGLMALGYLFEMSLLWIGCYGAFFSFCFLMMKNVSTKNQNQANIEENQNHYDILAHDGTPMAVIKGFIPDFIVMYLSSTFIVPYCMDSGILIRIVGRNIVLPTIFSVSDAYMNNQIMKKSAEYLKYRMIAGNLASVVFLAILRFMISYSSNVYDTFVMSFSSGVFEVILWSSYIPRSIYTVKVMGYVKSRTSFSICRDKRVNNLDDVLPQSNANGGNDGPPNNGEIFQIKESEINVDGFKSLFSQLNQEDNVTQHVISHRTNRSILLCMSEIQFIIFIPLILYLCNPVYQYLTFQPTSTVNQFFASVLIQLPIEILTQIASLCLENYLYGVQVPVEKSFTFNLKPHIMLQYALISLFVISLSTNAFWIPPENWPND